MEKTIIRFKISIILLAAFLIAACADSGSNNLKNFDYRLQGTWESNDPSIYSGTLVISYDRITITGYDESQTPKDGDDSKRPFRQFPKGRAMKGYSEEGKIFIENGDITEVIPYTYWEDNPPPDYKLVQYLRFNFGGRIEDLDYK
jgi:hypothetical protein